jgi:hypothetical protein
MPASTCGGGLARLFDILSRVAPCPTCAEPLEPTSGVFFCAACRASLQPRAALAIVLGVPKDAGLPFAADRFADALGPCAACAEGELLPGRLFDESAAACGACGAVWLRGDQLSRMRARADRHHAHASMRAPSARAPDEDAHRIPFDDVWTNRWAYPAALGLGVVAHVIGLSFLVWATVEMWFHELGHAVVAWLSGFVAVPLPFFTTLPRESRSAWVVVIALGMIGAIAYESWKRKLRGLVAFAGALAVVEITMTFMIGAAQARQWIIFAGQAGAIVLPTAVMVAFYQPIGWRWDFWRYPAIGVAAIGLVHALFIWFGVARGTGVMPHGSAVGDDSEGDMERLVAEYGWTTVSLARTYFALCLACLAALAVTYALFVRRAHALRDRPARRATERA